MSSQRYFSQCSNRANREKARRWGKTTLQFPESFSEEGNKPLNIIPRKMKGPAVKCAKLNCMSGRGRKRSQWKNALHEALIDEFIRLCTAGVKVTREFQCDVTIM